MHRHADVDIFSPQRSLGISRSDMPQVKSTLVSDFIKWLQDSGIRTTRKTLRAAKIKPTQKEINLAKVKKLADPSKIEHLRKPVIVSRDGYLLDGHHRWMALVTLDEKETIPAVMVDLKIRDLLDKARRFEGVKYKEVQGRRNAIGSKIACKIIGSNYALDSPIDSRRLGKNGPELPMLGLGGQVVFQNGSMQQAERLWQTVVDSGIRYIDTAHDYGDSQARLGKLMEGTDEDFFVATKTVKRGRDAFMRELDKNIKDLRREPDLLQIHAVKRGEQQEILKSGGALDAALEARDKGLCRFVGVTGHDDMDTLWEVVRWGEGIDTVLMALSAADTRALSKLVPYCLRHGIGTIAMKVMGRGLLVRPDGPGVQSGAEALRFVLSCPIDMAIVGFSFPFEVRECVDAATDFESMTRAEMQRVEDGVASYADDMAYYRGYGRGWDKTFDIRPTEDTYAQWKRPK